MPALLLTSSAARRCHGSWRALHPLARNPHAASPHQPVVLTTHTSHTNTSSLRACHRFMSYDNKDGAYGSSRMHSGRRASVAQAHARPVYTPGAETSRWLSSTAHFADVTDAHVWSSGVATRAREHGWRCESIGAYRHHHFVQKSRACGDFGGSSAASTVFFEREGSTPVWCATRNKYTRYKTAPPGRFTITHRRDHTVFRSAGAREP